MTAVLPGETGPVRVLDGVSLAVASGEIVDIVGPSGSGKTTLLRALARLLPGSTGDLILDSVPAEKIAPALWRSRVALQPQKPTMADGDVRANLLVPWTLKVRHGQPRPDDAMLSAALASVGLGDIGLGRDAARLSVGQIARVALLRVTLTRPDVLLLDEPDAALDDESTRSVTELTRRFAEKGGAIVRVRHHLSDGLASRRLRLQAGVLTPEATEGGS